MRPQDPVSFGMARFDEGTGLQRVALLDLLRAVKDPQRNPETFSAKAQ
jgi:hypothetical protein